MKSILCYGDSNTFGTAPMQHLDDARRFGPGDRWAGVLRLALGAEWWLVEEGLPGRTTVHDDPIEGANRNGFTYLSACLESHWPLDLVVIMLGTNDLKARFALPPQDIAFGAGRLVETVEATLRPYKQSPKVMLVCPPPILETGCLAEMFGGGAAKSKELPRHYKAVAKRLGAHFLDAGSVIASSEVDGIHLDIPAHQLLGHAVAKAIHALY
jgi:lysophospholipase L1-like esterase